MVVWSKPGSVIAAWGDIPDLLLCGEDVHTGVLFPHQIKNLIGYLFLWGVWKNTGVWFLLTLEF